MLLSIIATGGILSTFKAALIGSICTVAAGSIVGGVVVAIKKPFKIHKETKAEKEQKIREEFKQDIIDAITEKEKQENEKLQSQIDNVNEAIKNITAGVLSVQGRDFRKHCRELLEKPTMTENEWLEIKKDHDAYKKLKGNGEGDALWADLQIKHEALIKAYAEMAAQQTVQK